MRHALVLFLLTSFLFLAKLGNPLLEPEEARYAEIPRQMLAEGRWLVPELHGEPYLHKPPLFYWLVMACYKVCGVHDWAARLVPACAGILLVLGTYLWGRSTAGVWAGLAGAVILALTPRFVFQARMVSLDGLLCLTVVAGWAWCHPALQTDRLRWTYWLLGAICCGLGLLAKGPLALVLVVAPVALWCLVQRRNIPWLAWPTFLLTALAVAAPWYVALALTEPQAAVDFFWLHNVLRYVAPFDHVKPFWYYGPLLAVGALPWTLLLLPLTWQLCRRGANWPKESTFFLLCLGTCVAFFSLAGCKRPGYILPAFPALALTLGTYVVSLKSALCQRTWAATAACVFLGLAVAAHLLLDDYHRHFGLRGLVRRHADLVQQENLQVACFPRRWDSVSFYLPQADVKAFSLEESRELVRFLEDRPTLVFVKRETGLKELYANLPESLEVIPVGRQSEKVFVGVVRAHDHFALPRYGKQGNLNIVRDSEISTGRNP